jgi:hypothetical protein
MKNVSRRFSSLHLRKPKLKLRLRGRAGAEAAFKAHTAAMASRPGSEATCGSTEAVTLSAPRQRCVSSALRPAWLTQVCVCPPLCSVFLEDGTCFSDFLHPFSAVTAGNASQTKLSSPGADNGEQPRSMICGRLGVGGQLLCGIFHG